MKNSADILNQRYNNTINDSESPDFVVNGVIIHICENDQDTWYPPQANVDSGRVSFSYLRKDISNNVRFPICFANNGNGYIFSPWTKNNYDPLCFYPVDGDSQYRECCGCGDFGEPTNCADENPGTCYLEGITTPQSWLDAYGSSVGEIGCSFNTKSKEEFLTGIGVNLLEYNNPNHQSIWNEFIIRAWSTDSVSSEDIPIEAFVYVINEDGSGFDPEVSKAQSFALRNSYYQASGRMLDVVCFDAAITYAAAPGEDVYPFAVVTE